MSKYELGDLVNYWVCVYALCVYCKDEFGKSTVLESGLQMHFDYHDALFFRLIALVILTSLGACSASGVRSIENCSLPVRPRLSAF